MSLSYCKRQLLKEAAQNYHRAKTKSPENWSAKLQGLMVKSEWKVKHPGSDKFTAIKGPIIVKWKGNLQWSASPIKDEMHLYAVLRRLGFAKHTPRVYLHLPGFVIQQYFKNDSYGYGIVALHVYNLREQIEKYGYYFTDVFGSNVKLVDNTLKVIDGRIDYDN